MCTQKSAKVRSLFRGYSHCFTFFFLPTSVFSLRCKILWNLLLHLISAISISIAFTLAHTFHVSLLFSLALVAQPHTFSFLLDDGRPLSSGDSGQTGLLPSGVDSCQRAGLCPRLQCGRFLLAVMYSHHPSPGGLPPLISMPRPVTNRSSDCESPAGQRLWL